MSCSFINIFMSGSNALKYWNLEYCRHNSAINELVYNMAVSNCLILTLHKFICTYKLKLCITACVEMRSVPRYLQISYSMRQHYKTRAPRGTDRSPEYKEHFCYKLDSRVKNETTEWNQKQQHFIHTCSRSLLWIRFVAVAFRSKKVFWRRGPPPGDLFGLALDPPGADMA